MARKVNLEFSKAERILLYSLAAHSKFARAAACTTSSPAGMKAKLSRQGAVLERVVEGISNAR